MAIAELPFRDLRAEELESLEFQVPRFVDKVFKDECMYCFRTPFHQGGLFVCLKTFVGFCVDHITDYCKASRHTALLRIKRTKEQLGDEGDEPVGKISKLAIDTEGGFSSSPKFSVKETTYFVIFPDLQTAVSPNNLPEDLQQAIKEVELNAGATRAQQLEAGVSTWDGETKMTTKHLHLEQLDNGIKVPMSGWKCEAPDCDLQENLWLNLTDGAILCGRSQYIQEGVVTKGNNHMQQHFGKTGYPLVVKLGTIGNGTADVYSYDEDESVLDPNLEEHLKHFGIDLRTAEKTEKSTLELELDLNQKWEWTLCQEEGESLEVASGPGLVGMVNLGSSCYMNASVQLLCLIPDFTKLYALNCWKFFSKVTPSESADDFNCQTAKLFASLEAGDVSMDSGSVAVTPKAFRRVVAKGHPEFSTAKQQDAEEFIRYFLNKVDSRTADGENPVDAVRFKLESRFEDVASKKVRYTEKEELILQVAIPVDFAVLPSMDEDASVENVRRVIALDTCLEATFAEMTIDGFRSPVTGEVAGAKQSHRFATFPDYLLLQLSRFCIDENMKCRKVDVDVSMDMELNLGSFKARGIRPWEELLPDEDESKLQDSAHHDGKQIVKQLRGMGFPEALCRRAVFVAKSASVEEATDWITSHLDDPGLMSESDEIISAPKKEVPKAVIEQLASLGFAPVQVHFAAGKCGSVDVNAIAEWLFSHEDSIPPPEDEIKTIDSTQSETKSSYRDGSPRYSLVGFISHMGSSPHSGHYVAHLKKGGRWYLYNDEKVAVSKKPPFSHGYVYLYARRNN